MEEFYYNADVWVPFKAIQALDRATPVTGIAYDDVKVLYGPIHKQPLSSTPSTVTTGGATWTELVLTSADFYEKTGPGAATGDYIFRFPFGTFTELSTMLYHVEMDPGFTGSPFLLWSDRFSLGALPNPLYDSQAVWVILAAIHSAVVSGADGNVTALGLMTRIHNYLYGDWKLEEALKQWSVKAPDTGIEEARFNLLDQFGNPTATPTRIFERVKI